MRKSLFIGLTCCVVMVVTAAALWAAEEEKKTPEQRAWEEVNSLDKESLQAFLKSFPDGELATHAKVALDLQEGLAQIREGKSKGVFTISPDQLGDTWKAWQKRNNSIGVIGYFTRKKATYNTFGWFMPKPLGGGKTPGSDIIFDSRGLMMSPTGDESIIAFRTGGLKFQLFNNLVFETPGDEPMYFGVFEGKGLVHLKGKGKVTLPDGTTKELKSDLVIMGKVKAVTMETSQVEINMFTATIVENPNKSVSLVNIKLVGKPDETFKIPVNDIVELPPFQDLKGRHQMLGGLLILSPLQNKLGSKDVKLSCIKAEGDAKQLTYLVRDIEIAGFTPDSHPRFNGQVAFKNESDVVVWVEGVDGFDEEITCGQVRPSGTQIVFKDPAKIPAEVTITWRKENEEAQKSVVDFGGIQKTGKSGTISLHFTKNHTWTVKLQ